MLIFFHRSANLIWNYIEIFTEILQQNIDFLQTVFFFWMAFCQNQYILADEV